MFLPIPAIDLMDGRVVRLSRGRATECTVYSEDPVAVARNFESAGARRIHIVDLDGAFSGHLRNLGVIRRIRGAVETQLEVGGGLRSRNAVEHVLALGIDFAILGTSALRDRPLLESLAAAVGNRLIVGLDARAGKLAIEGWTQTSDVDVVDFARDLQSLGVGSIIATDIATDGMLSGPNLEVMTGLADAVDMYVIASGGVSNLEDLLALRDLARPNLIGAITGRALYEGRLDLATAIATLQSP